MRLLTRRIYRAFPELDRYDDEQCARFVKSARKGGLMTILHTAAILITVLPLISAALVATLYLYDRLGTANIAILRRPWGFEFTWLLASCLMFACAMSAGLLVRDTLLRRRLRFVLRTRGACPACQYSLVGLAVSDSSTVQCPECGVEIDVDASLAELTTEHADGAIGAFGTTGRIRRTMTQKVESLPWWTPKRKKRAIRTSLTILAVPTVIWGGYEWWLAHQAAHAAADRLVYATQLRAILVRPPAQSATPNRLDAALAIVDLVESIDAARRQAFPQNQVGTTEVNFEALVADTSAERHTSQFLALRDLDAKRARAVLRSYLSGGLALSASALAQPTPVWISSPTSTTASGLYSETCAQLTRAAALSPIFQAWAVVADESNQEQELLAAMEANLALCRVLALESYPGTVLSITREYPTLDRIRSMLLSRPTKTTLSSLAAILDRQKFDINTAALIHQHRISMLDIIAASFESTDNVRFALYSKPWSRYRQMITPFPYRLGTYDENKSALNAVMDAHAAHFALSPQTRATTPPVNTSSGLLLVDFIVSRNLEFAIRQIDAMRLEHAAIQTMIALEHFHLATGAYPQSLSELVPRLLPQLPPDLWSQGPLQYRPIPAHESRSFEPHLYLLYSVGPDSKDDDGQPSPDNLYRTGQPESGDIVFTSPFNDPKWPPPPSPPRPPSPSPWIPPIPSPRPS